MFSHRSYNKYIQIWLCPCISIRRIKVIFLERGTTAGKALADFSKVISLPITQLAHYIHLNLIVMIVHWFLHNGERNSHIIFVNYEDNMMITMNHGQDWMGHYYHQILDLFKRLPVDKQGSCWDPTDRTAWLAFPLWRCPICNHWFSGSGWYSSTYFALT